MECWFKSLQILSELFKLEINSFRVIQISEKSLQILSELFKFEINSFRVIQISDYHTIAK